MKKVLGVFGVLVAVCAFTSYLNPNFLSAYNIQNIIQWTSLFGILSIGAAFVIMSGGIDLSIGSVVGLVGSMLPLLLIKWDLSVPGALLAVTALSLGIGLFHGLLITKLKLQPFVVTLCGLLLYRGAARWVTGDDTQGYGGLYNNLRDLANGKLTLPFVDPAVFRLPVPFVILVGLAILAAVFLNLTVYGRYLLAVGRNEQAARYSGVNTDAITILAYVLCSLLAGLGGVLFSLDINSVQPAGLGNFYELYAIAAAVLGGCSLRGGEGTILGVLLGTALIRVLYNATNVLGIPTQLEFATIGIVILAGVIVDEAVKRIAAARRRRRGAAVVEDQHTPARVA
jgi:ribose transport system permease protein